MSVSTPNAIARQQLRNLIAAQKHPDLKHEATAALLSMLGTILEAMPSYDTHWRCNRCGKVVKSQCPRPGDCHCKHPNWRILEPLPISDERK